jgi:hypothetical protein
VHVNYVWFLFDQTPTSPKRFGAQCNELAVLFETLLKFLGIDAAYNQILPSAQNGIIRLWNFHNQIDVAWFLNNSDSTFHHSIDEMQWDGALGSLMPVTVKSERLLFDMGTWNEGEGSVYVNGKVYPMVYNYNYIGVGSSIMTAARNALVKIDSIDCVRPNYLQMYRVLYKFNHCNVGGEEQCKHATEYYVEIPNL